MCLGFIGYEGPERHVKQQRKAVGQIVSKHGGLCIGSSPGELYDQKKFDTPYIRDFLLDRGVLADVSETAAPWSELGPLHAAVTAAARSAFADLGVRGYIMCHLSHSYHAGACLYFTFAVVPSGRRDGLEEYGTVKSAIQQAFVDNGGTLSHHHAVGTEHAEWLEQDISAPGVGMLQRALRRHRPRRQPEPGEDRVSDPPELDAAWSRSPPARAVRGAVLGGVFDPLMSIYTSRTVRGREHLDEVEPPGRVRRQPLEPLRHAGDPARAARPLAPAHGRGGGRRLLLRVSGGWGGPCRSCSAPCRWRATAADSTRTPPSHITRLFEQRLEPRDVRRGHALARRQHRQAALRRGGARGPARPRARADPRLRLPRRHAGRPLLAEVPSPASSAIRSRSTSAPPIRPEGDEHRTEVMERVRVHLEHS